MPASSKKQQKFMGIVRSIQKGEAPAGKFSKAAQKAAKSMKKSSVKKYAKTKHDDLPTKKESTAAYKKSLEKIARDKQLKMISKKDKEILMKIAKMMREDRDYKDEYKKFQSSTKAKKYRAELNKYNRKKGTYGNGDGKDASHKGGKIVGFESQSKNRGRAEKSRLKKESIKKIVKEEVQKILNESVGSKKYDGRDWFWPHDYRHYLRDASPAQRKKIHDAWLKIGVPVKKTGLKISDRYLEPKKNQLKKAWTIVRKVVAPKELGMPIPESVNEAMSEPQRFKVYNSLKKGDIVSIKYDSSIQKGSKYIPYIVTKGKTKLMKGKIERIILKNPSNPRFKAYLYNRDGDVSLALGDMAASIVDMKKGKVKESVFDLDEACQKGYMTHPTRKTKIMFGKRYRNCVKKEGVDTTMTMEQAGMIADNICVNCGDFANENLRKWFSDRWVNIGKKKKGGGHPPCGSSGKKRGYAKCVPASKAASMSKKQKASATRRKRAAQNKAGRGGTSSLRGGGKKPIRVSTKPKK